MNALVIGGTGKLSGRLVEMLLEKNHHVYILTRGTGKPAEGTVPLIADRNSKNDFQSAIRNAGIRFDVVYDCICMNADHAKMDLEVLPEVTNRLIVVSTDSVYDPEHKEVLQTEDGRFVNPDIPDYAGGKRSMELKLERHFGEELNITVFRPGHIYGPQFDLGCYPMESRKRDLPEKILREEPLRLVGCGIYILQPIYVDDLANAMIDATANEHSFGEIFCIGGPDRVENRIYYEIMAELLGRALHIEEVPLTGFLEQYPEYGGHLCHRAYSLEKMKNSGIPLPTTHLKDGLRKSLIGKGYL